MFRGKSTPAKTAEWPISEGDVIVITDASMCVEHFRYF